MAESSSLFHRIFRAFRYRDFRMLIPFIIQFGMYVCPVAYSSHVIHDKLVAKFGLDRGDHLFLLYSSNPMVGVIDGFRWAILGNPAPGTSPSAAFYWPGFVVSVALTIVLLVAGLYYFRKTERAFADVI